MSSSSETSTVYAPDVDQALTQLKSIDSGFLLFGFSELSSEVENQQQQQQQQPPKTLYIQASSLLSEKTENESGDNEIYEQTKTHLTESTVQYIVYKSKTKYLFASWIGQRVKPMIKVKCSAHKDSLFQLVEKTCEMKFAAELSGINTDNHQEQINEAFMNSKLFTDNNSGSGAAHTTEQAPKNASATIMNRYQPSSSSSAQSSSSSSSNRGGSTTNLAAQLRLVLSIDEDNLQQALKQMQASELSWVTLAYDDNGVLSVTGSGPEQQQVEPSIQYLSDTDINFVLYKWNMGTELGYGKDTEKILLVVWVGSRINSIRRGKINQHKSNVYSFVNKVFQLSGEYEVTSHEDLTNDIIKNRMLGNKMSTTTAAATTITSPTPSPRAAISSPRAASSVSATTSGNRPTGSLWKLAAVIPKTKFMMRKEAEKANTSKSAAKSLSTATNTIKVFASEQCAEELEKFVGPESKSVWALFGYNAGSKSELKLVETGTKEAEALLSGNEVLVKECTEESLSFIIVKVFVATKRGVKKIVAPKYILVTFKGTKLKPYFKVISANHAGKLKNTVAPIVNVSDDFVTITSLSELDDLKKLFSRDEIIDDPALIEEANNAAASSVSSFVKSGAVPTLAGDLSFENEKDVQEALKDLQADSSDTNWVMIKYASRRSLKYETKGSGGMEEFKTQLNDNEVQYVFYKLFIEELGGSAKIVLIASVGKSVKMALKATSTPDRIALFQYAESLCGVSSEFQANEFDEINQTAILGKLTGSKGKTSDSKSEGAQSPAAPRSRPQFGGKNQELKIANEEAVNNALKELKDDNNPINFLLFGYDEQGANLELKQSGTDGMDGLRPLMHKNQVQYALLKLLVEETGYGGSPKITLIAWVGEEVAGMAKAKSSTHRLLLKEHCSKILAIAAEYPVNLEVELNETSIRAKLTGSKGKIEQDGGVMAPSIGTTRSTTGHKKFGGKDGNLRFADDKAVLEDIERLKDNNSGIKWLMFGYNDPEDFYTTSVVHKGSGAVSSFKPHLSDNTVNYIVLRMSFMEYYEVIKVVLITYVGENSPSFLKSLSAGHRVNLMEFMRKHLSIGGEFHPQDLSELTDQALLAKITGAKGGENVDDIKSESEEPYSSQKSSRWEPQREVRSTIEVKNKNQFSGEYKNLEFTGKEEISKALKDLSARSDLVYQDEETRLDYIKLKIQGKGFRDVVVEELGKGSLTEEWREKHLDVNNINIFIFAVSSTEGGTGMITKFVFVQWNGANTKFLEKAQASELRQSLYNYCTEILFMGAEIQGCTLPEHVTHKIVMEKLTGSNVRGVETKVERKQEKFMKLGKQKSELKYENEQEVFEALDKLVQLEDPEIDWMLVTYKENTIDVLYLAHSGKGSVEEYKQYMTPTNMCYIVVKIMHAFGYAKDFEDTMSKPYYGLVHWKGAEVSVLEKALSSHHWNHFAKTITKRLQAKELAIQGSQYHAEHLEEVTLARIKKTMRLLD